MNAAQPPSEASTSSLTVSVSVSYAGLATSFTLPSSSLLSDLQHLLSAHFDVPPHAQKLISKGIKLTDPSAPLAPLLRNGTNLLLIGAKRADVDALRQEEEMRTRKKSAFEYHAQHKPAPVRSTATASFDSDESCCFHRIVPFPKEVPCEEERRKMLERLAGDEAVRDVMKRHRYQVGVLNELHPLLQPTLLGLNKNAGEEISLRLLTNDLEGTRAYFDVRKVLLHELAHNVHSDHNTAFNELNSLLNKEVAAYELARGIGNGRAAEAWSPAAGEEELVRTTHTLSEVEISGAGVRRLRSSEEDEVEERRERARIAAERRAREEEGKKTRTGQ